MKNINELEISDGIELESIISHSFKDRTCDFFEGNTARSLEFDLSEIEEAERLDYLGQSLSKIDSIQYVSKDDFFPDIFLKKKAFSRTEKEAATQSFEPQSFEPSFESNVVDTEATEVKTNDEPLYDLETVSTNTERIENETIVLSEIKPSDIDESLKERDSFDEEDNQKEIVLQDEEVFGVKKSEIFDSIDKQIRSARAGSSLNLKKVKGVKNGAFLPALVAVSSALFLFVAIPILSLYFNKTSKTSLEDNYIKDVSILERIAKQKEEEARLAKIKLEEERKNLEFEKNKIENKINEEYSRIVEDIHREFREKLDQLIKSGLPKVEIEKMKTQLETDKQIALGKAKKERDIKLLEQDKILSEKDKELKDSEDKLKKALENKDFEVSKITADLQSKLKERDIEKQNITLKLKELSETNKKIKEFNQMINQLIGSAIADFKNGKRDLSLNKLNNVVKYYENNSEFVNVNEDLKGKMDADLAMVDSISRLINESKINSGFNEDYAKIMDKFKRVSSYYKDAELNYNQKNYQKSNELYNKILNEFEEINYSYDKIRDIDIKLQNSKALSYYNSALKNMEIKKYDIAMNELSTIIRETPSSDYASMALNDIVKLADALSADSKIKDSDMKAKEIFEKASILSKNSKYRDASSLFNQIITDYPFSSYTKDALKNSLELNTLLSNEELKKLDASLRDKFRSDYANFIEAYKKADYKSARDYYITALKNNFNKFTNETIEEFTDAEDKYIASLVNERGFFSDKETSAKLEELKNRLESERDKELKERDDVISEYKNEITRLKEEYAVEKKKIEEGYKKILEETALKTKDVEAAKLKEYYENELKTKESDFFKKLSELEDKTNLYSLKTKELEDQNEKLVKKIQELEIANKELSAKPTDKSEIEKIKKELAEKEEGIEKERSQNAKIREELSSLAKKYSDLEEKIKSGQEGNVAELNKQLSELQKKYSDLEKQIVDNKSILDKQSAELDKKYKEEIAIEKQNLKDEFIKQLENLRNEKKVELEIEKSKKDGEKVKLENKFVARIIELIDSSITFQFFASDFTSKVSKGDILKIVRFDLKTNSEIEIGLIEISFSDKNSLFARGKIKEVFDKQSIRVNDLLKY